MGIIRKVRTFVQYIGTDKEKRMDYFLQRLVAKETGFNMKKIDVLVASKSYIDGINEFDEFEFTYEGKKYELKHGKLTEIKKKKFFDRFRKKTNKEQ